jgi:hypothetical protein
MCVKKYNNTPADVGYTRGVPRVYVGYTYGYQGYTWGIRGVF